MSFEKNRYARELFEDLFLDLKKTETACIQKKK